MKPRPRERTAAPVERVYGLAAALAAFERRPESVVNIAHTAEQRRPLAALLREAARRRIAYREVDDESLSRLAESVHHEGVCLLMRAAPHSTPEQIARALGKRGLILALDQVGNPHNVGAILRSAAYFGVHALLFASEQHKALTPAARRVAEGGAESVPVSHVADLPATLRAFTQAGLHVIGSDARAKQRLDDFRWPDRAVLVLGHEQNGLSPEARKQCKTLVRIDGTEAVDSLNVSVAAGIFLASFGVRKEA